MKQDAELLNSILHQTKKFYVLTLPKIASSWIHDILLTYPQLMDKETSDFYSSNVWINQSTFELKTVKEGSSYHSLTLKEDWKNLIEGKETSRDFIFFLRNPVNRFISILIKDVLFDNIDTHSQEFIENLSDYPNKEELNKFLKLNIELGTDNLYWLLDGGEHWKHEYVGNIVNYWVDKKLDSFFNLEHDSRDYLYDFKTNNYFLYYKLLFNSSVNKDRVKMLDIGAENPYYYFVEKYDLKIDKKYEKRINKLPLVYKNHLTNYIKRHINIIELILRQDVLLYIDIYEKLYSKKLSYDSVYRNLLKL